MKVRSIKMTEKMWSETLKTAKHYGFSNQAQLIRHLLEVVNKNEKK